MAWSTFLLIAALVTAWGEQGASPAPLPATEPARNQDREHGAFQQWLMVTTEEVKLPFRTASLITRMKDPRKFQLYEVADLIFNDDRMLNRYFWRLERIFEARKRLNPYDREVLRIMRNSLGWEKQEGLERLERLGKQWGIPLDKKGRPERWRDSLSRAEPPKTGDERYDPDSGLWERYDAKTKAWTPQEAPEEKAGGP